MTQSARFDEAWRQACALADTAAEDGRDVVLVRDLSGRSTLLIDDRDDELPPDSGRLTRLRRDFADRLGPYAGHDPVQTGASMFSADMFFAAPELVLRKQREENGHGRVSVLERTVVGADWSAPGTGRASASPRSWPRIALYGFKGGVGRSTATAVLARHLADLGKCVLVVDLDLESPGVSQLLADPGAASRHGIVDHLVESAVGNADGLELLAKSSLSPKEGNGEIWLAPASGTPREGEEYDYLAKLNRIYSDLPPERPGETPRPFAQRLEDAIAACEAQTETRNGRRPDVVLLDSRAGIHDIAAVALTRLSDRALLFAVDNPSTWQGYSMLFQQWKQRPDQARAIRDRLSIVAAMFHSAGDIKRLNTLRRHAYDTFVATLYDLPDDDTPEPYLPAEGDVDDKPYAPVPILFGNDLVGLDPRRSPDWTKLPFVRAAYREFLSAVEELVHDPYEDLA
ncbi:KGGVGR-motif variant AAA ATPase [Streptomyces montanisoli]|uniref:AAA family ATPase n=1 Tax=Streptomyces montanisoli TaxID=2798581 RepID=A0A940MEV5_9ACTN|nr:AAA family ATPase [Streptomyces montanisoli]MBP0458322.1 AAA family ATPase [Streptomyces montanisoli]